LVRGLSGQDHCTVHAVRPTTVGGAIGGDRRPLHAPRTREGRVCAQTRHARYRSQYAENGVTFNESGGDSYTGRNPDGVMRRAIDQLRNLGFTVTLELTAE